MMESVDPAKQGKSVIGRCRNLVRVVTSKTRMFWRHSLSASMTSGGIRNGNADLEL